MASGDLPSSIQLTAFAGQVYPMLDTLSYYQLLRVVPTATADVIRASYYKIAGQLHPDRYRTLPDPVVREQLETIYARVTEGYRVLTNHDKRAVYDKALATGKFRYEASPNAPTGPRNPEDTVKDAQAKKFFRMGMMCLGKQDWKGAVLNFNFAKGIEPTAPVIAEKLAEAQAALKK
jgi:curved DNA-binding protein CbpA